MFGVKIERDPNNKRMESEVTNKLQEIYNKFSPEPEVKVNPKTNVKEVSVEDAIKELLSMGVQI